MSITKYIQSNMTIRHWMECYNIIGEPDDDDPCYINIHDSEGTHAMEGLGVSSDKFLNPLKIKKISIGSP